MPAKFIKEFIKNPMTTGAIAPSSSSLAKEILHYWPKKENATVIEYGPGTGAITKKIVEKMKKHEVVAFELNSQFIKKLQSDFSTIKIINESAESLPKILKDSDMEKASLIVSGLPWAVFNVKLQNSILDVTTENLQEDGVFSTFAYIHALRMKRARHFEDLLNKKFVEVRRSKVVWRNLPPALIYHCAISKNILA